MLGMLVQQEILYNYGYEDYIYNYNYYFMTACVYAFNRNGVYYDTTDPIPKKLRIILQSLS